jgi:FkbM family methyltransferase
MALTDCGFAHDTSIDYEAIGTILGHCESLAYVGALCAYEAGVLADRLSCKYTTVIEASPYNFSSVTLSGPCRQKNSVALCAIISDTNGLGRLYITEHPFACSVVPLSTNSVRVPMLRLDTLLKDRPPEFLVIDAEGAALAVLRGAAGIANSIRAVLVETEDDAHRIGDVRDDVFTYLRNGGYAVRHDPGGKQTNSLWVRP